MPRYADGFVIVVPKKNLKAYEAMSKKAGKIWDPRLQAPDNMPFDRKRMTYGGFTVFVDC